MSLIRRIVVVGFWVIITMVAVQTCKASQAHAQPKARVPWLTMPQDDRGAHEARHLADTTRREVRAVSEHNRRRRHASAREAVRVAGRASRDLVRGATPYVPHKDRASKAESP